MRQVGDRLIPVGVTSGRIHPFASDIGLGTEQGTENPNENEARGSRRSRRRRDHQQQPQDLNHLLGSMGIGQDIEEVSYRSLLFSHREEIKCSPYHIAELRFTSVLSPVDGDGGNADFVT